MLHTTLTVDPSNPHAGWIVNRPTAPDLPVRWEPLASGFGFRATVDGSRTTATGTGNTLREALSAMLYALHAESLARTQAMERAGYRGRIGR